jgi:hypothetical protein
MNKTTTWGSSAGAKPMKEAITASLLYSAAFAVFLGCTRLSGYPVTWNISIFTAALIDNAFQYFPHKGRVFLQKLPFAYRYRLYFLIDIFASVIKFKSLYQSGCIKFPPFITAETPFISCRGVTAKACPKPMRARSTFLDGVFIHDHALFFPIYDQFRFDCQIQRPLNSHKIVLPRDLMPYP